MRVNQFLSDKILESKCLSLGQLEMMTKKYVDEQDIRMRSGKSVCPPDDLGMQVIIHMLAFVKDGFFKDSDFRFKDHPTYSSLARTTMQDACTGACVMILRKCRESKNRFVFANEFFNELHDTSLIDARYSDLVSGAGTIKLPFKLKDLFGDGFDEFSYYIGDVLDYFGVDSGCSDWKEYSVDRDHCKEKYMFSLCWRDSRKAWNYTSHYCTDPNTTIKEMFKNSKFKSAFIDSNDNVVISEKIQEDGYEPHIKSMFNCLLYLKSGDPDLRAMRNEITYRTPTSTKIIRKDKDLSKHEFTVVGFGYKKSPIYSKEFYYQPPHWARRGLAKVWTWCKGSLKRRKQMKGIIK